ncbi:secondary thiamine-phosphate synthase enzyme YjbQ [Thermogemmatispora sp.]|uniref:secondary thiamine-phosphate synthase enzyme YjbQ n=1 Tax=Thermogemmatispora sp. TaxID=1968838 RepID=UPI0035E41185
MAQMKILAVETRDKDQVIDITDTVAGYLRDVEPESGLCTVFVPHTTCAVAAMDLDPGTDLDLLEALRRLLPAIRYRHPHNPDHAPDHILATLIGPSLTVPYAHRRLLLGTWQRIVLVELDGPRRRTLHLTCSG